jgi:hypothetical protein
MLPCFPPPKPRIYIAGKIAKNDFRHILVPLLRGHDAKDGSIDCGDFTYVGPFFTSCDHGCYHRPGSHGAAGYGCGDLVATQREVFDRNQAALTSADLLFAFIEATDCHGTLFEIGWASRAGTLIRLTFAPDVDHSQLWVAQLAAGWPATTFVARDNLTALFRQVISEWHAGR